MEGVIWRSSRGEKKDLYHVIHKVPAGDSPYVRAKHLQLVEKDLDSSIVWFWKAINAGERVESALKDMAVVMTQQDRAEEAIEAIKSFRHLCSKQAQESLDNLLIDLYKGNLGWAYMQQNNFVAAEVVYRKAQTIKPDANKAFNLGICLMKQGHFDDARCVLLEIINHKLIGSEERRVSDRAKELLYKIESHQSNSSVDIDLRLEEKSIEKLDHVVNERSPQRSKRLPIFEEIYAHRDQR